VNAVTTLVLGNLAASLTGLGQLTQLGDAPSAEVCELVDCPRLQLLVSAIEDAVNVIEQTKSAFKSKGLAELRQRLELVLEASRTRTRG